MSYEKDLAKRILNSLNQKFTGDETARWLAKVDEADTEKLTAKIIEASEQLNPPVKLSPNALMERMFDDFQRYAYEFSKNGVKVDIQRPVRKNVQAVFGVSPLLIQGHLATREYTMVLQASDDGIKAFIIPSDRVLGFADSPGAYRPYMEIECHQDAQGDHIWLLERECIYDNVIGTITKVIFGTIVRVSQGEASPEEKFTFGTHMEAPVQAPSRDYETTEAPEFHSLAQSGQSEAGSMSAAQQVAFTGSRAQIQSGGFPQQGQSGSFPEQGQSGPFAQQAQSGSFAQQGQSGSFAQQPQSGSFAQQPQSGSFAQQGQSGSFAQQGQSGSFAQQGQSGSFAQQAQSGSFAQQAQSGNVLVATMDQNKQSVTNGCISLLEMLNNELSTLEKLGVKALQANNTGMVMQIMQRSQNIKEIMEKVALFTQKWEES